MVQACVGWRTMTGQRVTSTTFWPEICVDAETDRNPATENGIDRVEFAVAVNGGAPSIVTVSSESLRFPNYSAAGTPLQRRRPEEMAPFRGYGWKLQPGLYAPGVIEITATVYSRAGSATPLPRPIRVYNDSDGGDRRPSTKDVYVDIVGGNDANPGTIGAKIRTLEKAFALAAKNPAGSTLADRDMGGSFIHVSGPGVYDYASTGGAPIRHTSGDHWCTIVQEPGVFLRRPGLGSGEFVYLRGTGAGTNLRIKVQGGGITGLGVTIDNDPAMTTEIWLDGIVWQSQRWSPEKRVSILYVAENGLGKAAGFTNTGPNARKYVSCSVAQGVTNGWSEFMLSHDTIVRDYIQLANETADHGSGGGQICNQIVEHQRAFYECAGRVHGALPNCTISVPANGKMRIQANGPLTFTSGDPMDLGTLSELVGQTKFAVKVVGVPASWANSASSIGDGASPGSGFLVDSAGTNWVVLLNPAAVFGTAPSSTISTTQIRTVDRASDISDLAHPDLCFFIGGTQTNVIVSHVASRDLQATQSLFSSSANLVRACFKHVHDSANLPLAVNFLGGNKTDVYWYNNSIVGNFQFGGTQTRCSGVNNVFGTSAATIVGGYWTHNHFVSGSTYGLSATSGTWFASSPFLEPWICQPLATRYETGTSIADIDPSEMWPGSRGTTRGCGRFSGLFNWETDPDPVSIVSMDIAPAASIELQAQAGNILAIDVAPAFGLDLATVQFPVVAMDVAPAILVDLAVDQFAFIAIDVAPTLVVDLATAQGNLTAIDVATTFVVDLGADQGSLCAIDVAPAFGIDLSAALLDESGRVTVEMEIVPTFSVDLAAQAYPLATIDVAPAFGIDLATVQFPAVTIDVAPAFTLEMRTESTDRTDVYFAPRPAPGEIRRWPRIPERFWT